MQSRPSLVLAAILAALVIANSPAPVRAQTCDIMIASATWAPHPDPDSIYIVFRPDVAGTPSSDPFNPTEYDMEIRIKFNGGPLGDSHSVHLAWWQRDNVCSGSCPPNVCLYKSWIYKGIQWTDRSVCTLTSQNVCGCPSIGTPLTDSKAVPKPPGNGYIDVEILPLNLHGCTPINPGNDRIRFSYPGGGVPGSSPTVLLALAGALAITGLIAVRRRRLSLA